MFLLVGLVALAFLIFVEQCQGQLTYSSCKVLRPFLYVLFGHSAVVHIDIYRESVSVRERVWSIALACVGGWIGILPRMGRRRSHPYKERAWDSSRARERDLRNENLKSYVFYGVSSLWVVSNSSKQVVDVLKCFGGVFCIDFACRNSQNYFALDRIRTFGFRSIFVWSSLASPQGIIHCRQQNNTKHLKQYRCSL